MGVRALDPGKVHVVDQSSSGNVLLRTDTPVDNSNTPAAVFTYEKLMHAFSSKGVNVTSRVNLTDISLLHREFWNKEHYDVLAEKEFYGDLPQTINGTYVDGTLVLDELIIEPHEAPVVHMMLEPPEQEDELSFMTRLPKIVDQIIHALGQTYPDGPSFIFFHCHSGCERTGEVAAAYRMKVFGWNASYVWQKDEEECYNRDVQGFEKWGIEYYCRHHTNLTKEECTIEDPFKSLEEQRDFGESLTEQLGRQVRQVARSALGYLGYGGEERPLFTGSRGELLGQVGQFHSSFPVSHPQDDARLQQQSQRQGIAPGQGV